MTLLYPSNWFGNMFESCSCCTLITFYWYSITQNGKLRCLIVLPSSVGDRILMSFRLDHFDKHYESLTIVIRVLELSFRGVTIKPWCSWFVDYCRFIFILWGSLFVDFVGLIKPLILIFNEAHNFFGLSRGFRIHIQFFHQV